MKAKGHIPIRTCISCGAKGRKYDLLRLTIDLENRLVRDDSGRFKGRGAYVCDASSCLERLLGNKHLNRQFRTDDNIQVSREQLGLRPFGD